MAEVHTLDAVFKPVTCMRTVAGCHGLSHALDGGVHPQAARACRAGQRIGGVSAAISAQGIWTVADKFVVCGVGTSWVPQLRKEGSTTRGCDQGGGGIHTFTGGMGRDTLRVWAASGAPTPRSVERRSRG